jgi:hypothetical protein
LALSPEQTRLALSLAREIARAEKPHRKRVEKYRQLDDVYDAILKASDSKWRHDLHPPFALQFIETVVSAIVEEPSDPIVKPLSPKDKHVADKWELLLAKQEDKDFFAEKWPRFVRRGLKRGIAIAKVGWRQEWVEVLDRRFTAAPGNVMKEQDPVWVTELSFDQPTFIPIDACDFWWNPDATCPEEIDTTYYRTWETRASLMAMQEEKIYQNVDEIPPSPNTPVATPNVNTGEDRAERDEVLRAGPIEIIERWTKDRLVVIADRKVVIRDERNPFGHGLIPFVYATPIERDGHVVGKSLCELIAHEQTELWVLMNQRLDNTEVFANSVMYIPGANAEIMEALGDRFPTQRIPVDNMGQIPQWDRPNTSIIEPVLVAEDRIKQDMKDVTGAVDYVSGAGDGSVDQQTATEVTLMQSGAQRRLMSFKTQFANARNRAGQQQIELNKRLMTKPELIMSMSGGEYEPDTIEPYELANSTCVYQVADVSESMNQQQRRMEATIKLQTLAGLAPLMPGEINFRELVEDFSEAYGDDREAYLNDPPPPVPPGMPGAPWGVAPPMQPGAPPGMPMPAPNGNGQAPPDPSALIQAVAQGPPQDPSQGQAIEPYAPPQQPQIHINPVIHVPDSQVISHPPVVHIRPVPAPVVHVAAPNVTVTPVITPAAKGKRKMRIQRDKQGNITSAEVDG